MTGRRIEVEEYGDTGVDTPKKKGLNGEGRNQRKLSKTRKKRNFRRTVEICLYQGGKDLPTNRVIVRNAITKLRKEGCDNKKLLFLEINKTDI